MALGRVFRKHLLKIVLAIGFIYLVYTISSIGSLKDDQKKSSFKQKEEIDIDIKKMKEELRKRNKEAAGKKPAEPGTGRLKQEPTPLFQKIDENDEHRKQRLKRLQEIYKVAHVEDSVYKLNESLSRTIDLDRPSPDLRPHRCQELSYNIDELPTISVIFPIYNEALSMILRTVHSVINHTPEKLLKDVILVDDNAKYENLKEPLDRYIKMLPSKVKVLRNPKREGLIRARMRGAEIARGEVLLFQDSHTEFGPGWAEPTLHYLKLHPNTVVQPTVQELSANTISWPKRQDINYSHLWRGVFMWDMRFAWNLVPESYSTWKLQEYDAFPNPVLVGCSIVIRKDFFNKLGGFDTGLEVWGGENLELSFRTWMCGGKMVILPCSQIAHVFKPFSYSFDGDKEKIVSQNSIRVIETWMDDHRQYFYAAAFNYDYKRTELDNQKLQGLREHRALRERLGCKSFDWYLKNVLPEMATPSRDNVMFGEIQNMASTMCWKVEDDGWVISTRDCYTYSRLRHDAEFGLLKDGRIMFNDRCISVDSATLLLKAVPCHEQGFLSTGWSFEHDYSQGMTVGIITFTKPTETEPSCLQQITNPNDVHNGEQMPQVFPCKEDDRWQKWLFSYKFNFDLVPPSPQ